MRLSFMAATLPLVRLELLADGLRIKPSPNFLKSFIPVWEAHYDELADVQAVGTVPLFTGIRLRTATSDWVIFWTLKRPDVLRAIGTHGVTVHAEPTRFHFLDPGR
jgi:hypothetical protein